VSSDLTTTWWTPSVDDVLSDLPEGGPTEGTRAFRASEEVLNRRRENVTSASRRPPRGGLRARLISMDVVAAGCVWSVLGGIVVTPSTSLVRQWGAALGAFVATLTAMRLLRLYRSRLCVQRGQEVARIVAAVAIGALAFTLVRGEWSSRDWKVIVGAAACVLALIALRGLYGQWLRAQRAMGRHLRGVIMIGINDDALAVRTMLETQPDIGYEVRGVIGSSDGGSEWEQLASGRTLEELPELARQTDATGVLLVANALSASEVHQAIELGAAEGLHVQVWPGFRGLRTRRVRWLPMSGEPFLYVEPDRHPKWQIAAKRTIDLVAATIGLVITAPILLAAAGAILLTDRGPVLFRQVRIGQHGRPFEVCKLRTMTSGADGVDGLDVINERTDGPLFKSAQDPRVTKIGAILRALSIDELPQLFNVLTGTMSLVGPRPALPHEVAQFDAELLRRHDVKPGITGLWQLEARDNPSFHAYRRLDLLYVDNWSIGLDLYIIVATVPMVLTRILSVYREESEPAGAVSASG
jgi:exopolysaccharide biosynthesis polyprenyl glycosylphosphotransferase